MSRPFRCRRVCFVPGVTYFKPAGIPMRLLAENCVSVEEMEAIRLKDLEHLEQAECAARMNVSRTTFQRVLASARGKIADGLISGKALKIEGGNYELVASPVATSYKESGEERVKIAFASEDSRTIARHFGRAPYYVIVTIEKGKVTSREVRDKTMHHQGTGCVQDIPSGSAAMGLGDDSTHSHMVSPIKDCRVVIAGGMGQGAFYDLKKWGIEPIVTEVIDIDDAVAKFISGELKHEPRRVC